MRTTHACTRDAHVDVMLMPSTHAIVAVLRALGVYCGGLVCWFGFPPLAALHLSISIYIYVQKCEKMVLAYSNAETPEKLKILPLAAVAGLYDLYVYIFLYPLCTMYRDKNSYTEAALCYMKIQIYLYLSKLILSKK